MKDIERLFSEIKSNNKDEAKSIFDGIIADKVTKALDARKAAIAQERFNESTKELSEDDSYYALKDAESAAGGAAAFKKLSNGEQDALLSKEMEKLGYKKHPTRNTWVKK